MSDLAPAILDGVSAMPDAVPLMPDPISATPDEFRRFQLLFPEFTHRKFY